MRIKAISIVAPSGQKIASGEKTLEIRRWLPDLHENEDLLIVENKRFLNKDFPADPDGYARAIVRIGKIRPFMRDDMKAACATSYEEGWLAWEIVDARPLAKPFKAMAARKIYELDIEEKYLR